MNRLHDTTVSAVATARLEDQRRSARATSDEMWAAKRRPVSRIIGLLTGDVGVKADIAGGLRAASARERARGMQMPRGSSVPGVGLAVLAAMAIVVAGAGILLALLAWVAS